MVSLKDKRTEYDKIIETYFICEYCGELKESEIISDIFDDYGNYQCPICNSGSFDFDRYDTIVAYSDFKYDDVENAVLKLRQYAFLKEDGKLLKKINEIFGDFEK